jgi:RND family efflux transporter MFP subunit
VSDLKNDLASLRIDRDAAPRGRRVWPLVVLVALAGAAGLYAFMPRERALEVETLRPSVASAGSPTPSGSTVLTASGYVVARRKAVVSAKIQGRLSELRVEEGSQVRQGELLARLESSDYEAALQSARAQVLRAEADLGESQRQARLAQQLFDDKIGSRDALEAALSRVKIGEATLAQAHASAAQSQAFLENTIIRAPFSGVVVKKMAEVGESVAPIPPGVNLSTSSGAIVALADLATLEVEADVAEANVARLGTDQPAEVTVEAIPDRRYKAVLRQVIPTADRTKATVMVKVTILDKDRDLKPEMSAKVDFLEANKPAATGDAATAPAAPTISVAKEALATREGRTVVFVVQDGKVRQVPVGVGRERQGFVVVQEGLSGSETLVARPPDTLRDGAAVRVKS